MTGSWRRTCLSDSQSVNNRHTHCPTLTCEPHITTSSVCSSVCSLLQNITSKNTFWVVFKNSNTRFYDKFLFPSPFDSTLFINKPVFRLGTACCLVEIPRSPFSIVKYSTDLMIQLSTYIWYLCKYHFHKLIVWWVVIL